MEQKVNPLQRKYMRVEGSIDYLMSNGEWTDRYETLKSIESNLFIKNEYKIEEIDKIKGERTTIVNKETRKIEEI